MLSLTCLGVLGVDSRRGARRRHTFFFQVTTHTHISATLALLGRRNTRPVSQILPVYWGAERGRTDEGRVDRGSESEREDEMGEENNRQLV